MVIKEAVRKWKERRNKISPSSKCIDTGTYQLETMKIASSVSLSLSSEAPITHSRDSASSRAAEMSIVYRKQKY